MADASNGYDQNATAFMRARSATIGVDVVAEWASGLRPGADVLELGCGHGVISRVLVEAGVSLWAVDASAKLLAAFRRRFPKVPTECANAADAEFLTREFDGAIAWGLLFLLQPDEQRRLLRRIAKALRPAGRLLFTAPAQACEWTDALTDLPSQSLGASAYEGVLREGGMETSTGTVDEGGNHYYFARKIIAAVLASLLICAAGMPVRAQTTNAVTAPSASPLTAPNPGPCENPPASVLANRPGVGRLPVNGGAVCVALPGEVVIESGLRRQVGTQESAREVLGSGPLTLIRLGMAKRFEIGVTPPSPQSRLTTGVGAPFDTARGQTDTVIAAKYLVLDNERLQASVGAAYGPPTGTGEFTSGPTYIASVNIAGTLTPRLSFFTTQFFYSAIGTDDRGLNRPFFLYAPSFGLAYTLDNVDSLLIEDALLSRQGPLLPAGSRALIVLQRAMGSRFVLDLEYEKNLAPLSGTQQNALGAGFVWIVLPSRKR